MSEEGLSSYTVLAHWESFRECGEIAWHIVLDGDTIR